MKKNIVPTNFVYPEIKEEDFIFGSGQIVGTVLNPSGDWRGFLPPGETQNRYGVESSACFIEASQHAIATIQEQQYNLPDKNYSPRFNLNFADASPQGGDPLKGAQTFRDYGLIPDEVMPFADYINSWEEFRSFEGVDKDTCLELGKKWRTFWEPKYDIVFTRNEPVAEKYRKAKEALKHSPLPVSVYAWVEKDGKYIKPEGVRDNHLVELVYVDSDNCSYIWDTYEPFLKKLAPFYNFEFCMRWTLEKIDLKKRAWFLDIFANVWQAIKDVFIK